MTVTATTPTATPASSTSTNALASISSNYNEFLQLLTTQLQNQDPASPVDPSQFTSELAQFAGVEQQVSTNTNLTSLIQLAQGQQVLQGATLLGRTVDLGNGTLPLQGGTAHVDFTSPSAQAATITVTDSAGNILTQQSVAATAGSNGWDWNGQGANGVAEPDGAYTVGVTGGAAGATTTLAFTTRGTVTGITKDGSTMDVQLGATTTPIANVVKLE